VTELPARPPTRATPPGAAAPLAQAAVPSAFLTAGVLIFAANMRPVATSVGPLVHQVRDGLHVSGAITGLLVTIPVLCFGAVAPLAPLLSRRLGIARTLALILVAITAGLVLRVLGGVALLFAGTTLAAAGAACGNVLLPVVVRRSFADRIGKMSALYTTSLAGVAALSAGVTVPLANAIGRGWRGGLAVWALPAFLALLVWLPQIARYQPPPAAAAARPRMREVTRSPVTWFLTIFFGLQSVSFYVTLAWLPSVFESHGISNTDAGLLLGLCGAMAVPGALVAPRLAARWPDQRRLVAVLTTIAASGFAGLLAAPAAAPLLWAVLIGVGQGALFPLALTMIVLRSGAAHLTASLSTHVQSVGYLLAASGPFLIGALHDATGSWSGPVAVLLVLLAPQLVAGLGAARNRTIIAA
jgi:MFS transporter, CP family, cyanate transporter